MGQRLFSASRGKWSPMAGRWPGPKYRIEVDFRAPLEFVYRWCTDYTPEDAKYESESYQRRVLRRSRAEVVYEDLEETPQGWVWSRHVVRLRPPDRWHSDSVGSHRSIVLDYRLSRIPGGRTRLVLTARRRPTALEGKNPAKRSWERSVRRAWAGFARSLEHDFRNSVPAAGPKRSLRPARGIRSGSDAGGSSSASVS